MAYEYKPEVLCTDVTGYQAAMDRYAGRQTTMAAGGSATTAYECSVKDYKLSTKPTTRMRTDCATVADAQQRLLDGQSVVVAGGDMMQLRSRLAAWGVEG